MTKKNRIVAALLAVVVLAAVLCSALFIAAEVGHDCVGDGCPICCQINACQNILKNLSLAACAAALAAAITYTLCRSISACAEVASSYTLVSLKVKFSD